MSHTIPPSRRRAAGAGVWLALLALWIQALLPAVHQPAGAMSGVFAFGMSGSLCLAPGSAPVVPQDKAPGHKTPPCPICQTFQILAAGFAPPAVAAIPLPRFAGLADTVTIYDTALPGHQRARPRARAPPLAT
jgi:hypothetical protein